jgi:hypothetical protein
MFRTLLKLAAAFVLLALTIAAPAIGAQSRSLLLDFGDRVEALDSDRWTHFTQAGYRVLEVTGDTDTDLDCFVKDRYGNTLGQDIDLTDHCVVAWNQRRGDQIEIRIDNLGDVYNRYRLRLW